MIKIKNLMVSTVSYGRKINKEEQIQIARDIEKRLLWKHSIVCDIEVE